MVDKLSRGGLLTIAEDIEYFQSWWLHQETINATVIRHGSAALRRLLVEDAAGKAWRQMGFSKSPKVDGPDLLKFVSTKSVPVQQIIIAAAAECRFAGLDFAFFGAWRVDNPLTGVPAMADEGFAVVSAVTARKSLASTPSALDGLAYATWHLSSYLKAPGVVRMGTEISRREVIKHMANAMGGVHLDQNFDPASFLLAETQDTLNFYGTTREPFGNYVVIKDRGKLPTYYLETLAIGQAVGRSTDLGKLATILRSSL